MGTVCTYDNKRIFPIQGVRIVRNISKEKLDKVYAAINHEYARIYIKHDDDRQNPQSTNTLDGPNSQPSTNAPSYSLSPEYSLKDIGIGSYYLKKESDRLNQLIRTKNSRKAQKNNKRWNKAIQKARRKTTDEENPNSNKQFETKKEACLKDYITANPRKFRKMLKGGPPMQYRWSTWKIFLGPERFFVEGLYERLRSVPSDCDRQIRKDLHRTFPYQRYFSSKKYNNIGQEQLFNVLKAISLYFPSIGYTQGMNFIVGVFLLVSGGNELEAFWMFASLARDPKFLLMGIFDKDFPLLGFYVFVTYEVLRVRLPKVYNHIIEEQVPPELWLSKWFITLFVLAVPQRHVVRIWDYLFEVGLFGMVNIALGIIKIYEKEILTRDAFEIDSMFKEVRDNPRDRTLNSSEHNNSIASKRVSFHAQENIQTDPNNVSANHAESSFDPDTFNIEEVIKIARKTQIDSIHLAEYITQYEEKSDMKLPEPYKSLLESLNHPQNGNNFQETQREIDYYIINKELCGQVDGDIMIGNIE